MKNITNFLFKYFHTQRHSYRHRKESLLKLMEQTKFCDTITKTLMSRGYQPSLSEEKGVLQRIKNAGFGKLIASNLNSQINKKNLSESILKSKTNMTSDVAFKGCLTRLTQAANRVAQNCKFGSDLYEPTSYVTVFEEHINKNASSGYPLFKKKGLLRHELISGAQYYTYNDSTSLFNTPTTTAFRAQIREKSGEMVVKLRVMYPITGIITMMETSFCRPFIEHFQRTETFYSIGRTGFETGQQLKKRFSKSRQVLSSDISAFDQSMTNEVIIFAFGILRSQLHLDHFRHELFNKLVQYFLSSITAYKVGTDNPSLYIKTHGIPSGSGFTNIIGTLCHAIILEYLCEGSTRNNALICSDDNIFDSSNYDIPTLVKGYKTIFNLTVDPLSLDVYNDPKKMYYLGFTWINFERHVNPKLVLNQCVWHTDFRHDLDRYEREVARCASVLLNGKNGSILFKRLFPDVMNSLRRGENFRFSYLRSSGPPLKLEALTLDHKGSQINQSLKLHLDLGYLIR